MLNSPESQPVNLIPLSAVGLPNGYIPTQMHGLLEHLMIGSPARDDTPVILTKHGRGKYVFISVEEYLA